MKYTEGFELEDWPANQPGTSGIDYTEADSALHYEVRKALERNLNPAWWEIAKKTFQIKESPISIHFPRHMKLVPSTLSEAICLAIKRTNSLNRSFGCFPNPRDTSDHLFILDSNEVSLDNVVNDLAWTFSPWMDIQMFYRIVGDSFQLVKPGEHLSPEEPFFVNITGNQFTGQITREIYYISLNGRVLENTNILLCFESKSMHWFQNLAQFRRNTPAKISTFKKLEYDYYMETVKKKQIRSSFEMLILAEYEFMRDLENCNRKPVECGKRNTSISQEPNLDECDHVSALSIMNIPLELKVEADIKQENKDLWEEKKPLLHSVDEECTPGPSGMSGEVENSSEYIKLEPEEICALVLAQEEEYFGSFAKEGNDYSTNSSKGCEAIVDLTNSCERGDICVVSSAPISSEELFEKSKVISNLKAEVIKFHEEERRRAEREKEDSTTVPGDLDAKHMENPSNDRGPDDFIDEYIDGLGSKMIKVRYQDLPMMVTANYIPTTPIEIYNWCLRGMFGTMSRFTGSPEPGKKDIISYFCDSKFWTILMAKNDAIGPWPSVSNESRSILHNGQLLKTKRFFYIQDSHVFHEYIVQHSARTVYKYIYWIEKNGLILPGSYILLCYRTCISRWKEAVDAEHQRNKNYQRREQFMVQMEKPTSSSSVKDTSRKHEKLPFNQCAICNSVASALIPIDQESVLNTCLSMWQITKYMDDVKETLILLGEYLKSVLSLDGVVRICREPCHLLEESLGLKFDVDIENGTKCDVCGQLASETTVNLDTIRHMYELKKYFEAWEEAMRDKFSIKILSPLSNILARKVRHQGIIRVCRTSCHKKLLKMERVDEQPKILVNKKVEETMYHQCAFCLKRKAYNTMVMLRTIESLWLFLRLRNKKRETRVWVETATAMSSSVRTGIPIYICRKHYEVNGNSVVTSVREKYNIRMKPTVVPPQRLSGPLPTEAKIEIASDLSYSPFSLKRKFGTGEHPSNQLKQPKTEVEEFSVNPSAPGLCEISNAKRIVINTSKIVPQMLRTNVTVKLPQIRRAQSPIRISMPEVPALKPNYKSGVSSQVSVPPVRFTVKGGQPHVIHQNARENTVTSTSCNTAPVVQVVEGVSLSPVLESKTRTHSNGTCQPKSLISLDPPRHVPPGKRVMVMCALCPLARSPEEMLDVMTYEEAKMLQQGLNVPMRKFKTLLDKMERKQRVRVCLTHANLVTDQIARKMNESS